MGYHESTNVTCRVNAEPPVTRAYFYWYQRKENAAEGLVENRELNVTLHPRPQQHALLPSLPDALWAHEGEYLGITHQVLLKSRTM